LGVGGGGGGVAGLGGGGNKYVSFDSFPGYLEAGEGRLSAPLNFSMNDETGLWMNERTKSSPFRCDHRSLSC
jgi:hypothetical protein